MQMRTLILLTILLLTFFATQAQHVVADSATRKPLAGASLTISKDTAKLHHLVSDSQGHFTVPATLKGSHSLQASYLGYPPHRIRFDEDNKLPDTLFLSGYQGKNLQEVVIINNEPAIQMKGDTIEYNAGKFKTKENAVVEDLLQKMPGMRIERDGSIKAQGETVKQVLVDGKEFFGSDPAIATKNLPADMISKVQVFDKKSDMANFTGVEDGIRDKTINLVTKKNRKKGYFGNLQAGLGTQDRYEGGANVNSFVGDKQFALLAKANNVNKSGFSSGELMQMLMKNPDMMGNLPPFVTGELMKTKGVQISGGDPSAMNQILRPSGYTDTRYGGLQFNFDPTDKLKWRSSYFYNGSLTKNDFGSDRQHFLQDTAYINQHEGSSRQRSDNHRLSLSQEIKLNDKNILKITPNASITQASGNSAQNYRSMSIDRTKILNEGVQETRSASDNKAARADMLFMHRFEKARRSWTLSVSPEYLKSTYQNFNRSNNTYFNAGGLEEKIDQRTDGHSETFGLNGNFSYSEPLGKLLTLQLTDEIRFNQGDHSRIVRAFDQHEYSQIDDRYSDIYHTNTFRHTPSIALSMGNKKFSGRVGAGWEFMRQRGNSGMKGYQIDQSYAAPAPNLFLNYNITRQQKLSFNYNINNNMPGIAQLQPLEDNSDPLFIRRGNPNLTLQVDHSINLSYGFQSLDFKRGLYINMIGNITRNKITDSYILDTVSGKQLISPINVNGDYSAGVNGGFFMQLGKNGSSLDVGISLTYANNVNYANGLKNNNQSLGIAPDVRLHYYFGDNVVFDVRGNANYNSRRFAGTKENSWMFNYSSNLLWNLPWKFSLEAESEHYTTTGLSSGFNTTISLVNAGLTKNLGSKFSIKLEGKDLLQQNQSISRTTGPGFIEDSRNTMLGRYFLLSAIYKLKYFPK